ncbi:MAG: hypothetical protein ACREBU_25055, partial [Nitrososphaera sp.]
EEHSVAQGSFEDATNWLVANMGQEDIAIVPSPYVFTTFSNDLRDSIVDYKSLWDQTGVILRANTTDDEVSIVQQELLRYVATNQKVKFVVLDWVDPYETRIFKNRSCDDLGPGVLKQAKIFSFMLPHSKWQSSLVVCQTKVDYVSIDGSLYYCPSELRLSAIEGVHASSEGPVGMKVISQDPTLKVTLYNGSSARAVAEKVVNTRSMLFDVSITGLSLNLSKTGNPTGEFTVGVWNDDGAIVHTFKEESASILSNEPKVHVFDGSVPYRLKVDDRIGIKYKSGNFSNRINVWGETDVFDGSNSIRSVAIEPFVWRDSGVRDVAMEIFAAPSPATFAIDNSTITYWQNNKLQEPGAYIY